ncbi:thylakoid lumen 18.3 kDa protein, partial [Prunus dulcis]
TNRAYTLSTFKFSQPIQNKRNPNHPKNRRKKCRESHSFFSLTVSPFLNSICSPWKPFFLLPHSLLSSTQNLLLLRRFCPLSPTQFKVPPPHKTYHLKPQKAICSITQNIFANTQDWFSYAQQGLAALALSLALNFCPLLPSGNALASEFDVLNEGPPKDSYVVDDAGVLSRVTKSDIKRLMSELEYKKNFHINFITVRKLTSKADAFEYADQVLERWYPSVEEGNNKGIVVLVTSQKEGAITGGPAFVQAVGETILDATVSENLPVLATEEKYNEAIFSSAKRLVAAIDGLPDPGGPKLNDNKRESNFKTKEETDEKRGQFSLVVGGLLVIAFVVPMAQYYAYANVNMFKNNILGLQNLSFRRKGILSEKGGSEYFPVI